MVNEQDAKFFRFRIAIPVSWVTLDPAGRFREIQLSLANEGVRTVAVRWRDKWRDNGAEERVLSRSTIRIMPFFHKDIAIPDAPLSFVASYAANYR